MEIEGSHYIELGESPYSICGERYRFEETFTLVEMLDYFEYGLNPYGRDRRIQYASQTITKSELERDHWILICYRNDFFTNDYNYFFSDDDDDDV